MQWLILAAAAAAISQAYPIADTSPDLETRASGPQLATFDDIPVNQAVPVPYKGLNYSALTTTDDLGGRLGIAQSKPNFAAASAQAFPFINIQGTRTTTFDLDSFYFGCFDSRSQVATSCNFTLTGRTGPGSRDRYGPFLYSYTLSSASGGNYPMMKVAPGGWTGLISLYTQVIGDAAKLARTYQTIDNVMYTVHE